jgi:hypothetical protein
LNEFVRELIEQVDQALASEDAATRLTERAELETRTNHLIRVAWSLVVNELKRAQCSESS